MDNRHITMSYHNLSEIVEWLSALGSDPYGLVLELPYDFDDDSGIVSIGRLLLMTSCMAVCFRGTKFMCDKFEYILDMEAVYDKIPELGGKNVYGDRRDELMPMSDRHSEDLCESVFSVELWLENPVDIVYIASCH